VFGLRRRNLDIKKILDATEKAQGLINDLHENDPSNGTFGQAGILDGRSIVQDYIDNNEWGLAFEHLLYMIYESGIRFPESELQELHSIARANGIRNAYEEKSS